MCIRDRVISPAVMLVRADICMPFKSSPITLSRPAPENPLKFPPEILASPAKCCLLYTSLHDIENRADEIYEFFITRLFEEEKDCIELIKIKEIMYELEKTTDAAEHVGKILRSLIVKYA